ncbi:hypothetical protein ZHAS_00010798 [Anopheles sinensis]|uniref:Uncharacterized protein n=1 Tax=Anopheles sinensis TaxID=74873 RepID=A0A084VY86_ANOSI|nr:hypothetical protein ZHAS_00010798 [Anopheles sinensis]
MSFFSPGRRTSQHPGRAKVVAAGKLGHDGVALIWHGEWSLTCDDGVTFLGQKSSNRQPERDELIAPWIPDVIVDDVVLCSVPVALRNDGCFAPWTVSPLCNS